MVHRGEASGLGGAALGAKQGEGRPAEAGRPPATGREHQGHVMPGTLFVLFISCFFVKTGDELRCHVSLIAQLDQHSTMEYVRGFGHRCSAPGGGSGLWNARRFDAGRSGTRFDRSGEARAKHNSAWR